MAENNPVEAILRTGTTFQINSAKIYVPVVTLPINKNINFLENIKQGFKSRVSWNRYKSEITKQKHKQQFRLYGYRAVEMKRILGGYQLWNIVGHHGRPMKKMFHFKSSKRASKA